MYYNRTICEDFGDLLLPKGQLHWLYNYVKNNEELDFLIGKNDNDEWISVYRGLSRIVRIGRSLKRKSITISAADIYKSIVPQMFEDNDIANINKDSLNEIIDFIKSEENYSRYYDCKKEGYFQNMISREYGINSSKDSEFVIVDKEVVIGYKDTTEKKELFTDKFRENYKKLQKKISSINPNDFGSKLEYKSIGNELDFLAVNHKGDIMLIELKHGSNTSGIYLSPLQIGLYHDTFSSFDKLKEKKQCSITKVVDKMLTQKQKLGLINPDWIKPKLTGKIMPTLMIAEPNYASTAQDKFNKILSICRKEPNVNSLKNLQVYTYTEENGMKKENYIQSNNL